MFQTNREEILATGVEKDLDNAYDKGVSDSIDIIQKIMQDLKNKEPMEVISCFFLLESATLALSTLKNKK